MLYFCSFEQLKIHRVIYSQTKGRKKLLRFDNNIKPKKLKNQFKKTIIFLTL